MKKTFHLTPQQVAEAITSHYLETTEKEIPDNGQALLAEYAEDDSKMLEALGNYLADNDMLEEDSEVMLQYKIVGLAITVDATEFEGRIQ